MGNSEIFAWVTEIILIMTDTGNAAASEGINSAREHALSLYDKYIFLEARGVFFLTRQCEQEFFVRILILLLTQVVCTARAINRNARRAMWITSFCMFAQYCSISPFTSSILSVLLENKWRLIVINAFLSAFVYICLIKSSAWAVHSARPHSAFEVNSAEFKHS